MTSMGGTPEHVEGGVCWCDEPDARERAMDRLYPDRCHIAGSPGSPDEGQRNCREVAGHDGPCCGYLERRGGPCHFCGATYDGDMCPACWTSLEGMPLADIKAMFAAGAPELSIDPVIPGREAEQ